MQFCRSAILPLLALSLGLAVACKNKQCSAIKPYTDKAMAAVASPLVANCKHPEVLQAKFIDYCAQKGWCKADQQLTGPIAAIVCPIAVDFFADFLGGKLPPEAQCDPASGFGAEAIKSACMGAPF